MKAIVLILMSVATATTAKFHDSHVPVLLAMAAATTAATSAVSGCSPKKLRKILGWSGLAILTSVAFYAAFSAEHEQSQRKEDTDKLRTELTYLHERQDILYALADNAEFPLAVFEQHTGLLYWNPAIAELTKITESEIRDKADGLSNLITSPDLDLSQKTFNDENLYGKLVIYKAELVKAKITVRISLRLTHDAAKGKNFLSLWLQKEGTVIEPSKEKDIQKAVERAVQLQKSQQ
jgi:PAS domain-containing protein